MDLVHAVICTSLKFVHVTLQAVCARCNLSTSCFFEYIHYYTSSVNTRCAFATKKYLVVFESNS